MRRTELFGLPLSLLAMNAGLLAAAVLGGLTFGRGAGVLFVLAVLGAVVSVGEHGARSRRRDRILHREANRLANGESKRFGWSWEQGPGRDR